MLLRAGDDLAEISRPVGNCHVGAILVIAHFDQGEYKIRPYKP